MQVKMMQVGPIGTNCYLLEDNRRIAVIDPGGDGDRGLSADAAGTVRRPHPPAVPGTEGTDHGAST